MDRLKEIVDRAADGERITLDRAEYRFTEKDAFKGEFYPSNNDGGERNVVFYLKEKKDVTLDGNGARLIFDGKISPFVLEDCENVTLKNFTIDFLKPPCIQAVVAAVNEDYIELLIDKERFGYEIEGENVVWHVNGGDTDSPEIYIFDYDNDCRTGRKHYIMPHFVIGTHAEKHADSSLTQTTFGMQFPRYLLVKAKEGGKGRLRLEYFSRSARLFYPVGERLVLMLQAGNRSDDTIFLNRCKNVRMENVCIERGFAMGIIAQLCENIAIENCKIAPNKERGDLVSTTADSMMFVDCKGDLEIKNSLISGSLDDGLNVHGTYSPVDKIEGNSVCLHSGHVQQRGYLPYRVGDEIAVMRKDILSVAARATVVAATMQTNKRDFIVKTDRAIEAEEGVEYVAYNASTQPFVTVQNCTYERATCILISSENEIVFKNNKVHTLVGAMRIKDDPTVWYEAGKTNGVRIENNEFISCGEWSHDYLIRFLTRGGDGTIPSHKNAVIQNNLFFGCNTQYLSAQNVSCLSFKNNRFQNEGEIERNEPSVRTENCTKTQIEGVAKERIRLG